MGRAFRFMNERLGNRVDVALHDTQTTERVFWSPKWEDKGRGTSGGANSFVLVRSDRGEFEVDGERVSLVCINGIGEVRWRVTANKLHADLGYEKLDWWRDMEYGEELKAARHFGIIPQREG